MKRKIPAVLDRVGNATVFVSWVRVMMFVLVGRRLLRRPWDTSSEPRREPDEVFVKVFGIEAR